MFFENIKNTLNLAKLGSFGGQASQNQKMLYAGKIFFMVTYSRLTLNLVSPISNRY